MNKLETITTKLGKAYKKATTGKNEKDKWRKEFFAAITDQFGDRDLATTTVLSQIEDQEEAIADALRMRPGLRLAGIQAGTDSYRWHIILQEDPAFKPFAFVNPKDGNVYQRSLRVDGPVLDDDRLREDDPELWEEISEEVRVAKAPDDLTADQIKAIKPYLYIPKPTITLSPVRKAKEDELPET